MGSTALFLHSMLSGRQCRISNGSLDTILRRMAYQKRIPLGYFDKPRTLYECCSKLPYQGLGWLLSPSRCLSRSSLFYSSEFSRDMIVRGNLPFYEIPYSTENLFQDSVFLVTKVELNAVRLHFVARHHARLFMYYRMDWTVKYTVWDSTNQNTDKKNSCWII